jgi:hypothetical protein
MKNELVNKAVTLAVIGISAIALLFLATWGIWEVTLFVPPNAARVWALVATALLPVAVFVTWKVTLKYAAGLVRGIDTGIGAVSKAGAEAANLRVHVHHALRQKEQLPVVLPDVQILPRQLASGGQVINL